MGLGRLHPDERAAAWRASGAWTADALDDLLRARARERPDAEALVDPPNAEELIGHAPARLTWTELDGAVDRFAAALAARGLEPGDVVAAQLPNVAELPALLLACARARLVLAPLPMQYREYEIAQLTAHVGARLAVTTAAGSERFAAAGCPVITAAELGNAGHDRPPVREADPNACVTVCFTSGTEATPKAVPRCAGDWIAIARATVEGVGLDETAVILGPFPMVNMAGIGGIVVPWLLSGAKLILHHPFDFGVFLGQIATERPTYTVAPPPLLDALLTLPDLDLGALRTIGSGSAPLNPAMVRAYAERHDIDVLNFFGSNEGIALLGDAVNIPDPETRARLFPRPGGALATSPALDRLEVRLAGDGELLIRGPMVIAGYLRPDGTLEDRSDADGWLATGDVFAFEGEADELLRYVDRKKDLIVRGGMNISPAELEALLAAHPGLAEVAVVGLPGGPLGESACVVGVAAAGAPPPGLDELVAFLREQRIASYKLPERLELVDALPRNPLGKVLKRELRERYAA